MSGSGPHGRIVAADIEAAKKGGVPTAATAAQKPASAPAPVLATGPSDEKTKLLFAPGSYEEIPHDGMRKTIARRLTESKQTVPHFYLTADCDIDALLKLREDINKAAPVIDGKPAYKVSVNDMVIKALALSLRRVPDANVSWTDGAMLKHKVVDVGVAVSIPGGLITPIVRNADTLPLSGISNAMKDLAARAKNKKLAPNEYQGGSTAVSNLGMFGVKNFSAVINPPHATILAVGAGRSAGGEGGRHFGCGNADERYALDRSPRGGWGARGGDAAGVPGDHREPDQHGGVMGLVIARRAATKQSSPQRCG